MRPVRPWGPAAAKLVLVPNAAAHGGGGHGPIPLLEIRELYGREIGPRERITKLRVHHLQSQVITSLGTKELY